MCIPTGFWYFFLNVEEFSLRSYTNIYVYTQLPHQSSSSDDTNVSSLNITRVQTLCKCVRTYRVWPADTGLALCALYSMSRAPCIQRRDSLLILLCKSVRCCAVLSPVWPIRLYLYCSRYMAFTTKLLLRLFVLLTSLLSVVAAIRSRRCLCLWLLCAILLSVIPANSRSWLRRRRIPLIPKIHGSLPDPIVNTRTNPIWAAHVFTLVYPPISVSPGSHKPIFIFMANGIGCDTQTPIFHPFPPICTFCCSAPTYKIHT